MRSVTEEYGESFFARRHKDNHRAPVICNAIRTVLNPVSVVDVGCAHGDLVAEWNKLGVESMGVEGSLSVVPYLEVSRDKIVFADIRLPIIMLKTFDLVTCFEVAEHIDECYTDIFVKNLAELSDRILMSAAPPGQPGHLHVNCQPKEYWNKRLYDHGYFKNDKVCSDICDCLIESGMNHKAIKRLLVNMIYYTARR